MLHHLSQYLGIKSAIWFVNLIEQLLKLDKSMYNNAIKFIISGANAFPKILFIYLLKKILYCYKLHTDDIFIYLLKNCDFSLDTILRRKMR